jgi:hypothetical protein
VAGNSPTFTVFGVPGLSLTQEKDCEAESEMGNTVEGLRAEPRRVEQGARRRRAARSLRQAIAAARRRERGGKGADGGPYHDTELRRHLAGEEGRRSGRSTAGPSLSRCELGLGFVGAKGGDASRWEVKAGSSGAYIGVRRGGPWRVRQGTARRRA